MRSELYWIDGPWPGRLAIMPRPRGGDWLETEVESWRRSGVDVVVSLLAADEVADLDLADEEKQCRLNDIQYRGFPIIDRSVPVSREETLNLLTELADELTKGSVVAVHCRQGIGRAALIAICLLVLSGSSAESSIQRVSAARGLAVPETPEQHRFVSDFARRVVVQPAP